MSRYSMSGHDTKLPMALCRYFKGHVLKVFESIFRIHNKKVDLNYESSMKIEYVGISILCLEMFSYLWLKLEAFL
jgi:hypothetical protein